MRETETFPSSPFVQVSLAQLQDPIVQQVAAQLSVIQFVQPPVAQLSLTMNLQSGSTYAYNPGIGRTNENGKNRIDGGAEKI
jgi:hypothetical protein